MMKTTFLIGSLLLTTASFAQFNKGDHLINGSVGLGSSSTRITGTSASDLTKGSGVNLNLSVSTFSSNLVRNTFGFYVSNNVAKRNLNSPPMATVNSSLDYGVFFSRAKLLPIAKSLYLNFPFTVSAGLTNAKSEIGGSSGSENRTKGFAANLGVSAGLLYQLNNRWVLTLSLPELLSVGYSTNKSSSYTNGVLQNPGLRSSSFALNGGIGDRSLGGLSVGFGYIIPRKK